MEGGTFTRIKRGLGRLFALPFGTPFASQAERRHARVGPAHLWKMKRDFQLDFLKRMGLERGQRLLDLGCGTLRGGLPVIAWLDPGHYTGLEVRAEVLVEARAELAEAGLEHKTPVLLHVTDLGHLQLDTRFAWIWAFSVLIHMDDATLERALTLVARQLAPAGAFYANVRCEESGAGGDGRWQGFPVVTRAFEFYRDAGARHGLVVRDLGALAALGHTSGDPGQDRQHMLVWRAAEVARGTCGT